MKKYIITSICTLVISLFGTLGAKDNLSDIANKNNPDNGNIETQEDTTKVEDDIRPIVDNGAITSNNEQADVQADNNNEITNIEDKASDDVVSNKGSKKSTSDTKEQALDNKSKDNSNSKTAQKTKKQEEAPTKKNTAANTNKVAANSNKSANTSTAATNNNSQAAANSKVNASKTNNLSEVNKNVYVYKNVDLSQCGSVEEVISKLQNSGINNINKNNISDIKSLEGILDMLKDKGYSNNTGTKTDTPKTPVINNPGSLNTTKPGNPSGNTSTTKPGNTSGNTGTNKPETNAPVNSGSTNNGSYSNSTLSNYASEVLRLVNQERAKAGLSAFTTKSTLTAAANKRAQETVQSFSHTRPNGSSFSTVLKEFGVTYRAAGENIAYGQKSPQEVVTGWMNSPGHRANILNGNFNTIGIGVYQANGRIYWTQLFTN